MITGCKLYVDDSSDEEEVVYSKDKIEKQVNSLFSSENNQYISSYILQEISQSIIENSEARKLYLKRKKEIINKNQIISRKNKGHLQSVNLPHNQVIP